MIQFLQDSSEPRGARITRAASCRGSSITGFGFQSLIWGLLCANSFSGSPRSSTQAEVGRSEWRLVARLGGIAAPHGVAGFEHAYMIGHRQHAVGVLFHLQDGHAVLPQAQQCLVTEV